MKLLEKARCNRNFPPPEVRRHLRKRAGLTQHDIAAELEIDRATVARYELGQRNPAEKILARYAALLDALALELSKRGRD